MLSRCDPLVSEGSYDPLHSQTKLLALSACDEMWSVQLSSWVFDLGWRSPLHLLAVVGALIIRNAGAVLKKRCWRARVSKSESFGGRPAQRRHHLGPPVPLTFPSVQSPLQLLAQWPHGDPKAERRSLSRDPLSTKGWCLFLKMTFQEWYAYGHQRSAFNRKLNRRINELEKCQLVLLVLVSSDILWTTFTDFTTWQHSPNNLSYQVSHALSDPPVHAGQSVLASVVL